ncbi:MAG TPA: hypothetical protein VEC01_13250 [Noviherbaspirillum sp.]|uniref:hypothetical protein n=1 Tax=Noviherbaspirillum sp. TaxID=1926288 RepID=UPI002D63542B|nr:hypothetical protein [Noviherbaspirillum sp.]HYD96289.1 hypothetical protein [Noviherbaspirillum sp.]
MNTHLAIAAGLVAGLLATAMPAQAHGGVQWSVTVNSPGYYYVPPPQGVVVWPQSQYIYGAPPSAFAQPPTVVYVQPRPVYPPPVLYVDPYARPYPHEHRYRGWDDRPGRFRR